MKIFIYACGSRSHLLSDPTDELTAPGSLRIRHFLQESSSDLFVVLSLGNKKH